MSEERRKKAEEFKKANAAEAAAEERTVDGKTEYLDTPTGEWVSKGELKKRAKGRQKEEAAAAKAAAKKAKDAEKPAGGAAKKEKAGADEELDPTKYTENRKKFIQ